MATERPLPTAPAALQAFSLSSAVDPSMHFWTASGDLSLKTDRSVNIPVTTLRIKREKMRIQ